MLLLLLFSGITLSGFVINAVVDYRNGEARFMTLGYPGNTIGNLNHEYRIGFDPQGCMISPLKSLKVNTYNATIRSLINVFGFQKGSYVGPLLSEDLVLDKFKNEELQTGTAELIGKEYHIEFEDAKVAVDLSKQHGMLISNFCDFEYKQRPRMFKHESILLIELNDTWVYTLDLNSKTFLNNFRLSNKIESRIRMKKYDCLKAIRK